MPQKNSIVVDGVTYYREQPELTKAKVTLEKWDWLKDRLAQMRVEAQRSHNLALSETLTFNKVEAEGFLRCAIQIANVIKEIERELGE